MLGYSIKVRSMRLEIVLSGLVSLLSFSVFGKNEKQFIPARREIVQVSAGSPDGRPLAIPTFTVFVGVPRDIPILGMSGMDSCDWRFASNSEIPQGPWKYRDQQFHSVATGLKIE